MDRLKYWLRNVFGFSQVEINGFYTITLLMVLVVTIPFLYAWLTTEPPADFAAEKYRLDSLEKVLARQLAIRAPATPDSGNSVIAPLFNFNPNDISVAQWQALGIQKFIAERIIKYRQKGGKFSLKKDLLKIYGFPATAYTQLEPYILLPDSVAYTKTTVPSASEQIKVVPVPKKVETPITAFDLNSADTSQLKQIRGIGSALSRRILNYRNALGGFVSEAQVKEVYDLDSTIVKELLKYGFVTTNTPVKKIPVNTATIQELAAHPYVSQKEANIIVAYRGQHGRYTSPESLYAIRALERSTLDKLAPYLSFE